MSIILSLLLVVKKNNEVHDIKNKLIHKMFLSQGEYTFNTFSTSKNSIQMPLLKWNIGVNRTMKKLIEKKIKTYELFIVQTVDW